MPTVTYSETTTSVDIVHIKTSHNAEHVVHKFWSVGWSEMETNTTSATHAREDLQHQKPRETKVEHSHKALLPPRDEADHDAPTHPQIGLGY